MVDYCVSHEVVATLMALVNGSEQKHHIFIELTSVVPLTYLIDTFHDDLVNNFACVPVYKCNPSVYNIFLNSKLNFNCLKHLNASNDIVKSAFLWLFAAHLVH